MQQRTGGGALDAFLEAERPVNANTASTAARTDSRSWAGIAALTNSTSGARAETQAWQQCEQPTPAGERLLRRRLLGRAEIVVQEGHQRRDGPGVARFLEPIVEQAHQRHDLHMVAPVLLQAPRHQALVFLQAAASFCPGHRRFL